VSAIIFLPVNPASPVGPPITNLPLGLSTNLVSWSHLAGIAYLITNFSRSPLMFSLDT